MESVDLLGPRTPPFRIAFVPGVTPDKWARIWRERVRPVTLTLLPVADDDQLQVLSDDRADMVFVRLPVDREGLSIIPLYRETTVVVASKDHPIAAFDELSIKDLADEHLLQDPDTVQPWRDVATEIRDGTRYPVPPLTTEQVIETCAAGGGIALLPMSVARLHYRKDLIHRPVTDAVESQVGLAWPTDATNERTDMFVGIVRGRTENSSRNLRPASNRQGSDQPSSDLPGSDRPAPATNPKSRSGPAKGRGKSGRRR